MARMLGAFCLAMLLVSWSAAARGQPCDCACTGRSDNLLPCDPCAGTPHESATIAELQAVMASSLAVGLTSYVFATAWASTQPHFVWTTDTIPVAGAIVSAARNGGSRDTPLLLFAAATQAIAILVATVAGTEIAEERRRWDIMVGASSNGAGAMFGLRY
jgi:hypothetical protein